MPKKQNWYKNPKTRNSLVILFLLFGGMGFFTITGLSAYTLSVYDTKTTSGSIQGSYYSVSTGWTSLTVQNMNTGQVGVLDNLGSGIAPVLDPDGVKTGTADIQMAFSTPYRTDDLGNEVYSDAEPEVIFASILTDPVTGEDKVYTFHKYHFSVDVTYRTDADMIVEDFVNPGNIVVDSKHPGLYIGSAGAFNPESSVVLINSMFPTLGMSIPSSYILPAKNVQSETDEAHVTGNVFFSLTPWTFGTERVTNDDGTVSYYYEDSWMGVLGARVSRIDDAGQVRTASFYSSDTNGDAITGEEQIIGDNYVEPIDIQDAGSTEQDIAYVIRYIGDTEEALIGGLDPRHVDPYDVEALGKGTSLSFLDLGGSINNRVFDPTYALTTAPSEGYVRLETELRAGAVRYTDHIEYNYYRYYPAGIPWLLPYDTYVYDSNGYKEFVTGGQVINSFISYTVTFTIASIGQWDFSDLPSHIQLEVPPDLQPNMQLTGNGIKLNNTYSGTGNYLLDVLNAGWRAWTQFWTDLFNSPLLLIIFIVIILALVAVAYFVLKRVFGGGVGKTGTATQTVVVRTGERPFGQAQYRPTPRSRS